VVSVLMIPSRHVHMYELLVGAA